MSRRELALAAASALVALLAAELLARAWVASSWPPAKVAALTGTGGIRGRFAWHPQLGYALAPGYAGRDVHHNALGLRGRELALAKPPGALRVALVGASTAYGDRVADSQTSAVVLEGLLGAALAPVPVEAVNAGVPGYTSRETRLQLRLRVLPLQPDAVLILDGRNDVLPQLFNHYRDDYAHYRDPERDFRTLHYGWKRLFRVSRLALLLIAPGEGRFGFHALREHPVYAAVRTENRPSAAELVRHTGEPARFAAFRRNLADALAQIRAAGALGALATMPFRAEAWQSGLIEFEPGIAEALAAAVARNNASLRELARQEGAILVDAEPVLSDPRFLVDDCHFNAEGERAFAELAAEQLLPALRQRLAAQGRP